jgi:thiol-disulfide isomerase/thioredoxin
MVLLRVLLLSLVMASTTEGILSAQTGIRVGTPAPAVTINDLHGKPFAFAQFIGKKPALIQFWATWCELCERLEPKVRAAAAKYGSAVEFIGVNVTVNQKLDRVRRWVDEHKPVFRALWDDRGVAVRAYDVPTTSFIAIIDAKGKVAYTGVGADQDVDAAIRKVLGSSRGAATVNQGGGR